MNLWGVLVIIVVNQLCFINQISINLKSRSGGNIANTGRDLNARDVVTEDWAGLTGVRGKAGTARPAVRLRRGPTQSPPRLIWVKSLANFWLIFVTAQSLEYVPTHERTAQKGIICRPNFVYDKNKALVFMEDRVGPPTSEGVNLRPWVFVSNLQNWSRTEIICSLSRLVCSNPILNGSN